jgi:stage V sporulation protein R
MDSPAAVRHPSPPGARLELPLPGPSDWSFELIELYHQAIQDVARRYGLDTYPNQLEIITAEQMMDAYASVGMPVNYRHWSYGKEFINTEKSYRRGQMGLAYEIVINSNPCISYLMEENSMAMQALVISHAAITCSACGPMRRRSSITWSMPAITSATARSAMASRRSSCFSTVVMR